MAKDYSQYILRARDLIKDETFQILIGDKRFLMAANTLRAAADNLYIAAKLIDDMVKGQ